MLYISSFLLRSRTGMLGYEALLKTNPAGKGRKLSQRRSRGSLANFDLRSGIITVGGASLFVVYLPFSSPPALQPIYFTRKSVLQPCVRLSPFTSARPVSR